MGGQREGGKIKILLTIAVVIGACVGVFLIEFTAAIICNKGNRFAERIGTAKVGGNGKGE